MDSDSEEEPSSHNNHTKELSDSEYTAEFMYNIEPAHNQQKIMHPTTEVIVEIRQWITTKTWDQLGAC